MALLTKLNRPTILPGLPSQSLLISRGAAAAPGIPIDAALAVTLGAVTLSSAALAPAYPVLVTSGASTTNGTSVATASVTPDSDKVIFACVGASGAVQSTPTCSGNGLTWVQVSVADADAFRRLTVFRALGTASAGAITFDFGVLSQNSFAWNVVQFSGADATGTNGSGAVVQAVVEEDQAPATSNTITLAALGSANNVNLTYVLHRIGGSAHIVPDADFVELSETTTTADTISIQCEWARNQTDCTPTFGSDVHALIGIEVKTAV